MSLKKAVVSKLGILSGEVGNLITEVRKLREDVVFRTRRPQIYVSVMLLGECLVGEGSTRRRDVVMLSETYSTIAGGEVNGSLEPMMPIAPGAWLVVVGAPALQYVRIGRDLQVGNVGKGSPVVRLRDAVQVGSRVQFTVSWDGKEQNDDG